MVNFRDPTWDLKKECLGLAVLLTLINEKLYTRGVARI